MEESKRGFKKYTKRAAEILADNARVQSLTHQATDYLKSIVENNDKLKDFSDKVYTMVRMVKSQVTGEYTVFPWKSLMLVTGALLYFITPTDLIPDFLPVIGLTDDIAIVVWIFDSIKEDVELFETWENTIEVKPINESKEA
ncbi:YkvA family protein [Reichenbachiella versicolor]|uniref:YkvA family protein n=1 Tax=Reichenbachiella versicolor TaxID=1821036 RepID=UPI0013A59784|nr:YkvA family protein [Reichenbachiella versicolor]